jgi:integral membrane protein
LSAVGKLVTWYRILAFVVGVLLVALAIGMVMKYGLTEGTEAQVLGEEITSVVALVHGWIYIVYVVVAFVLSRRAGWSLGFLAVLLLAGLIPVMIFFVEHRVMQRLRAEHAVVA